jgi:putative addiction module component (TIGR02574 family)
MDYQSVLDEIQSWPVGDRVRLVQDVCGGIADRGEEAALSDEMKTELDRRIAEMDRYPDAGMPWEDVKSQLLARHRK